MNIITSSLKQIHFDKANHDERFNFIVEWYDPLAALLRRYQLLFFPKDNSIEMHDIKQRRKFLSRTKFESVTLRDLFIGGKLNICSRQLLVKDFGDSYTRRNLEKSNERTLAVIKPDAVKKLGQILNKIRDNDLEICRGKMVLLSRDNAAVLYEEHKEYPYYIHLINHMSSGPVIAMELRGVDAIEKWKKLIGPVDSDVAMETDGESIRAEHGIDDIANAVHGADSQEAVERELEFFFPSKGDFRLQPTTKYVGSSCCIIKPHAVKAGFTGDILNAIKASDFEITDFLVISIDKVNAVEFYNVYKGVVAEFQLMVDELASGPSVVVEISSKDEDTVTAFRELCGPADPEIAQHIKPKSLRAVFGKDKIQNAVHCTDLTEDGSLEVEYFFRILNN